MLSLVHHPWFCDRYRREKCVFSAHAWHPDDPCKQHLKPYEKVFLDLGDYFNVKKDPHRSDAWPPEATHEDWWRDPDFEGYREASFRAMTRLIQDCDFS